MFMILTLFACSDYNKTFFYDISSTVLVSDDQGVQLNLEDVEFCQRFQSEDYDTTTSWNVHNDLCEFVDIKNGVAILENWEGEYFGPDVTIGIDITIGEEVYSATILDNDTDVWCDNQVITSVDEHNQVTFSNLCSENYERYLLWSLEIPSKLDDTESSENEESTEEGSTEEEPFQNDDSSEDNQTSE
jgi:hypothetical protein